MTDFDKAPPTVKLPNFRVQGYYGIHIHVTPTDFHPMSEYNAADVQVQRFICPVCLKPYTLENIP